MNILFQPLTPSMTSRMTVEQKAALLDKMMDKFNQAADDYIDKAHLSVNHIQLRRKFDSDCSMLLTRGMDEYVGIHIHQEPWKKNYHK